MFTCFIHSFRPVQYATIDFGDKLKKSAHIHMMGMAKKFTFDRAKDGHQPGPGAYNSEQVNSLERTASKSPGPTQPTLAFGSSKAQNDKLQYHGQQSHFLGREGAIGPGGYDPKTGFGSPKKAVYSRLSALSRKGAAASRDDRGLAPSDDLLQRKLKTYNMSHS